MDLTARVIYDWNRQQWRKTASRLAQLPHALLLSGIDGLGKNAFAAKLASVLLCSSPSAEGEACGRCKSCALFEAGTHPDFYPVLPAADGKSILIDQIRALAEFVALRPHTAQHKVVVISPADAMNTFAANSLLKILEEPPLGCYLILVSAQPAKIPATVRSRCSGIELNTPEVAEGSAWLSAQAVSAPTAELLLALSDCAPLAALRLHADGFLEQRASLLDDIRELAASRADPISCAGRWKKLGAVRSLAWFLGFVADLARVKAIENPPHLANPDLVTELQDWAKALNLEQVLGFFTLVSRNRGLMKESLDELMLLEETLVAWLKINRK